MSAQPPYRNTKAEEYARWRRRDHANIEAMQNLAIARIAEQSGVEMPPNVRHLISALQGAHGGGEVAFEEFSRDYLTIGRQLQFTGSEEAIRQRVRRWIDDLLRWQRETTFELFSVVKGGDIIGTRPDGTPIRKATLFIDNLKPHSDDAVQRARSSELWRGDAQKGIKAHPGKALDAQIESLLKALPRIKPEPGGEGEKRESTRMPAGEYEQKREEAILKALEAAADGIEERDGDSDLWLERIERAVRKMRDSRRKTAPARQSWITLDEEEDEQTDSGTAYKGITPEGAPDTETARPGIKNDTQAGTKIPEKRRVSEAHPGITNDTQVEAEAPTNEHDLRITDDTQAHVEIPEKSQNFEPSERENEPECHVLPFALQMAEAGIRVFPLYGVCDGICDCPEGSECRSPGKHPIPSLTPQGVKNATTDTKQINKWFAKYPHANYGWAMGGSLRLIGVDVDPRSGGDASLCDLREAHGDDWLKGFMVQTGSLGYHIPFRLPEGIESHRGKLAPGIDLKGEGGYLVGPGSMHVSGRRYEVIQNEYIQEAPAWLVEELTREAGEPPSKVIDFQERRERLGVSGSAIVEGERNVRLFKVGCALWGKGEVSGRSELFQRLQEVNVERVSPSLDSDEVWKIAESISRLYPLGVPIQEGAA